METFSSRLKLLVQHVNATDSLRGTPMKKFLLTTTAMVLAAPAFAADVVMEEPPAPMVMEVPAATGWSGVYVGVQAGYAFGGDNGVFQLDPFTPGLETAFSPGFSGDFDDGFIGGAHVGYDWQYQQLVFGAILDVTYADISDSQSGFSTTPAFYTIERELDWMVTARARLGYAFNDRFLVYGTGGAAFADIDYRFNTNTPAAFSTSGGGNNVGYTVGGGIEMKATDKISFGLEYLYTNFGDDDYRVDLSQNPTTGAGGVFGSSTIGTGSDDDFDFHTIQAKMSYRF